MGHRWGYKQTYNWMAASCKEQSTVTICCWVASPCLNLIDGIWLVNCLSPNGFVWKLTGNWNTHWWIIVFLIKVATKYTYIYLYILYITVYTLSWIHVRHGSTWTIRKPVCCPCPALGWCLFLVYRCHFSSWGMTWVSMYMYVYYNYIYCICAYLLLIPRKIYCILYLYLSLSLSLSLSLFTSLHTCNVVYLHIFKYVY